MSIARPLYSNKGTKAEDDAWARRVKQRDGGRCRFERKVRGKWVEHGIRDRLDACHIIPRDEAGKAKFSDDVGITGCRECHDSYDARFLEERRIEVRVPIKRARRAWKIVCAVSKVPPSARWNPDAA